MKSLVLSVSPNTSTDRVSVVERFTPGEPVRTILSFDQAGGSGAHATGVVVQLGGDARSIVLLGSYNRDRWIAAAQRQNMPYDEVQMEAPNRSTFVLIDKQQGNIAEVIDPGPRVGADIAQRLLDCTEQYLDRCSLLILSGSLPPGIPDDFYVSAIELARRYDVKTLVDASSTPLKKALTSHPWAVKPNLFEFHQLVGVETQTLREHIDQMSRIVGKYADVVLLSLGNEGLMVGTETNVWHMHAGDHGITLPGSTAINTIGCGDALVGGFSYATARGDNILEAACWGVAAATANLGNYDVPSCPPDLVRLLVGKLQVVEVQTMT
ncbi:MAG: hypothetical protein IPK19_25695 [Chloroflexi bacterium]|nr:hypothetical protein [Chloroflexota bacterium]